MTTEKIIAIGEQHGATHIVPIDPGVLIGEQCFRDSCATNACGNYGKYWTCPPGVGELQTIVKLLRQYPSGVLIQNISEIEDSWDFEGMGQAALTHNNMIREIADELRSSHPELQVKALGNGGCSLCESCTYPESPCIHPDQAVPSISGYGINVKEFVESLGLKYINGQNTVSFVGLVLIDTL